MASSVSLGSAALASSHAAPSLPVIAVADHLPKPTKTGPVTDAQILALRQAMAQQLVTDPTLAYAAVELRKDCTVLDTPALTAKDRADDIKAGQAPVLPDASDLCVAALTRQMRGGAQGTVYQDILEQHNVDKLQKLAGSIADEAHFATVADLPQRIADAIRDGKNEVSLGGFDGGLTASISSGLAFDAGFTSAWGNQGEGAPSVKDDAKLKAATENCVAQTGVNKVCLAVGYVQGARAYESTHSGRAATLETGSSPVTVRSIPSR